MSYPLDPAETINMLTRQIGEWADDKGFRDDWKSAERLEYIASVCERHTVGHIVMVTGDSSAEKQDTTVVEELRRIAGVVRNNVVGTKLALMHSELSEALETLRDTGVEGILGGEGNFMEELADCEIRIKDTAHMVASGSTSHSLGQVETDKIKVNNDRPHKHGRKM